MSLAFVLLLKASLLFSDYHVCEFYYQPEWMECLDNGEKLLDTTSIYKTINTTYNYVLSTFSLIFSNDAGETTENTNKNTSWENKITILIDIVNIVAFEI